MTTGERLKRLRTERGWSLRELSKRCGIAFSVLSHLEGDRRKLNPRYADMLGKVFSEAVSLIGQLSLDFDEAKELTLTKDLIVKARAMTRKDVEVGRILRWPSGMVLILPKVEVMAAVA